MPLTTNSYNHYYEKFEDGTINDITDEIPFEIPNNWKWIRHNQLFDIVGGSQPPKSEFSDIPQNGYVRLYQTRDYGEKPVPVYVDRKKVSKFSQKGDIILARYGGSLGKVFWAEDGAYNVALAKVCKNYESDNLIYDKFLFIYYLSGIYQLFVKSASRSAQAGFNKEDLNVLFFPLPPYNEQKRIVDRIDIFKPYVEKYTLINNKLELLNNSYKEDLKKSILQYAIQGKLVKQDSNDESAEVLINKILDEKRELIKTKKIKKENLSVIYKDPTDNQFYEKFDDGKVVNITDEIPFEIPDSWYWSRLDNLVIKPIKRGKSPKYVNCSDIYVFAQKCNQKNGIITLDNAKYLDTSILKKYDETDFLKNNDIVINSTGNGTLGRIGLINDKKIYSNKVVVDSHVTLIRINSNYIDVNYIFFLLKNYQKYLESQASGSTNQTELSPEIIKKLLIPIPTTKEQYRISSKITDIFNHIETAE